MLLKAVNSPYEHSKALFVHTGTLSVVYMVHAGVPLYPVTHVYSQY